MFKKKKDVWDWEFEQTTHVDYQLTFRFKVRDSVFMQIFNQAKEKLEKKNGVSQSGEPALIDKFPLDQRYFNLIKVNLKKPFNLTSEQILKSYKFFLMDYHVVDGWFERDDDRDWIVSIVVQGTCDDRR